jgi:hypothetical protein
MGQCIVLKPDEALKGLHAGVLKREPLGPYIANHFDGSIVVLALRPSTACSRRLLAHFYSPQYGVTNFSFVEGYVHNWSALFLGTQSRFSLASIPQTRRDHRPLTRAERKRGQLNFDNNRNVNKRASKLMFGDENHFRSSRIGSKPDFMSAVRAMFTTRSPAISTCRVPQPRAQFEISFDHQAAIIFDDVEKNRRTGARGL